MGLGAMSGTSHTDGRIRFSSSEHFDGEEPFDTRLAQDALIGGGNAQADQCAQHLINWMAPVGSLISISEPYMLPRRLFDTVRTDVWYALMCSHVGPIRVQSNAESYRFRLYVQGASTSGDSVDFACSVTTRGVPHVRVYGGPLAAFARKEYTGITATTPAQLTPATGDEFFELTRSQVWGSLDTFNTRVDIAGTRTALTMPWLEVKIFGRTSNASSEPALYGVHLSEFVGDG